MQILLFGQDTATHRALADALRGRGHQVHPCEDQAAVRSLYGTLHPPLVVLAGTDADSLSLCRQLREGPGGETLVILMVLSQDDQTCLPRVMEAGADDYVLAPLSPERLEARLAMAEQRVSEKARRRQVQGELEARARQQAVVSELGLRALSGADLEHIMAHAVRGITEALDVEFSKVLERLPDEPAFVLRAGVGWKAGYVGRARVDAGTGSQAGYTLLSKEPVVVEDLRTDSRFAGPTLLHEHGIISGISVVIAGESTPYGVLGAHTAAERTFSRDDLHFLQAVANVLAAIIKQRRAEAALREHEARLQRLAMVASNTINGVIITDAQRRIEWVNEGFTRITGYALDEVRGQTPGFALQGPGTDPDTVAYMRSRLRLVWVWTFGCLDVRTFFSSAPPHVHTSIP